MRNLTRLRNFIERFTQVIEQAGGNEAEILAKGKTLLTTLINHDDWLPDAFARMSAERYEQYLLYCDPQERFSVVSFVWGPGHTSPIHDHTVWGMVGVLRGSETCEEFERDPATGHLRASGKHQLLPGDIDLVSPRIGDIHRVSNALTDHPTVSIHVYGANIGTVRRHIYAPDTGQAKPFVSGYSTRLLTGTGDHLIPPSPEQ